jgi:hypothetical protein
VRRRLAPDREDGVKAASWREHRGASGRRIWVHVTGRARVVDTFGTPHPARYVVMALDQNGAWVETASRSSAIEARAQGERDVASVLAKTPLAKGNPMAAVVAAWRTD